MLRIDSATDRGRGRSPTLFSEGNQYDLNSSPVKHNSRNVDESLAIDMSQNDLDLSFASSPANAGPSRHPTARTIVCDMDADIFSRSHKRRHDGKPISSKYFPDKISSRDEGDLSFPEPPTLMESNVNVLVAGSSSPVVAEQHLPPTAAKAATWKRTNPFPNTKEESEKRKVLKTMPKDTSVVDMTEDTPERPPLATKSLRNAQDTRPLASASTSPIKPKWVNGQTSIVDFVGIKDAQGRPKKGVVGGARVKRRV